MSIFNFCPIKYEHQKELIKLSEYLNMDNDEYLNIELIYDRIDLLDLMDEILNINDEYDLYNIIDYYLIYDIFIPIDTDELLNYINKLKKDIDKRELEKFKEVKKKKVILNIANNFTGDI